MVAADEYKPNAGLDRFYWKSDSTKWYAWVTYWFVGFHALWLLLVLVGSTRINI